MGYRLDLHWERISREIKAECWDPATFLADKVALAAISGREGVHVTVSRRQREPHCIPVRLNLTCSLGFYHLLPLFIPQGSAILSSCLFFRDPSSSPLSTLQGSIILPPCPFPNNSFFFPPNDQAEIFLKSAFYPNSYRISHISRQAPQMFSSRIHRPHRTRSFYKRINSNHKQARFCD